VKSWRSIVPNVSAAIISETGDERGARLEADHDAEPDQCLHERSTDANGMRNAGGITGTSLNCVSM